MDKKAQRRQVLGGNFRDMFERTLGERLRAERERLGLTQAELASACGVHRKSQGNYEGDDYLPGAAYWDAAARAGIDVAFVRGGAAAALAAPDAGIAARGALLALLRGMGYNIKVTPLGVLESLEGLLLAPNPDDPIERERAAIRAAAIAERLVLDSPAAHWLVQSALAVERSFAKAGITVPAHRFAQAVSVVYQSAMARSTIDPEAVTAATGLAA